MLRMYMHFNLIFPAAAIYLKDFLSSYLTKLQIAVSILCMAIGFLFTKVSPIRIQYLTNQK